MRSSGRGGGAIAVQADVAVEAGVARLFEEVDARLGAVTALVNNAGIVSAARSGLRSARGRS